eukprot:15449603-Alexandrium_andersonii.AAC.1
MARCVRRSPRTSVHLRLGMPRRAWRSSRASAHRHWGCPCVCMCRTSLRPHVGSPVACGVRLGHQCISTRRCPNAH